MEENTESIAKIYKALCDKNRVEIIKLLQAGELCACKIGDELGLAQSKLSYHMKVLCESNLVESWYVGKWTHYKLYKPGCEEAVNILKELTKL